MSQPSSVTNPGRPKLRIGVLQATSQPEEDRTLAHLTEMVETARDRGVQLLVTPELLLCGYAPEHVHHQDGGHHRDQLAGLAARFGVSLVGSTVEHENGRRYISASLYDSGGNEVTRYRKHHLFGQDEESAFTPGESSPTVVEVLGVRVALGICFDVEFPEFVRSAALEGAELLCVPTAVPLRDSRPGQAENPFDTRIVPSMVIPTRALESQVFIAYANHGGPGFAGLSTVADPYGRRIATASDGDDLLVVDVDLDTLEQARHDTAYLAQVRRSAAARPR